MKMSLKNTIFAFLISVVAFSFADAVTPVKHRTIKGDTTVYTSEQIDTLIQDAGKVKKIIAGTNVTVSPSSGEGEVTVNASGVSAKHIAMFIIPMNSTASTSMTTSYSRFELKASYNNFSPEKSGGERCCYYVHSDHADQFNVLENDKARIYINHGGTDQRSYVKLANTLGISYAPSDYIVLVDTSQCWSERSDGSWLNSEDPDLMWTFVKTMNSTREEDVDTGHALWRPIQPVKWLSELPNWAE